MSSYIGYANIGRQGTKLSRLGFVHPCFIEVSRRLMKSVTHAEEHIYKRRLKKKTLT